MRRLLLFVPLGLFAALSWFLFKGLSLDPKALPSALIGKQVPAFSTTILGSKQPVVQSVFEGEPRLLNVWGTWCPTCVAEHPYLMRLAEQGVKIVGLNYKDNDDKALAWLVRLGDPYEVVLRDPGGMIGLDLGVYGAPETYVIDGKGVVRYRHVGEVNERTWNGGLGQAYRDLLP